MPGRGPARGPKMGRPAANARDFPAPIAPSVSASCSACGVPPRPPALFPHSVLGPAESPATSPVNAAHTPSSHRRSASFARSPGLLALAARLGASPSPWVGIIGLSCRSIVSLALGSASVIRSQHERRPRIQSGRFRRLRRARSGYFRRIGAVSTRPKRQRRRMAFGS